MIVQHKAVLCYISLLLQDYLQLHGTATGRKIAVVFANIFMAKIEHVILSQSNTTPIFWEIFFDDIISIRGTRCIGSVKYLFGRSLIPFDFLKRIATSNFRDMRNFKSVVFGLLKIKCRFWVPKKGQLSFSERR